MVRQRKRIQQCSVLPEDLLHVIFSKLGFKDKISAGLVCKQWDQLLKTGTPATRHWVVRYRLNSLVSSRSCITRSKGLLAERLENANRCVTVLAVPPRNGSGPLHASLQHVLIGSAMCEMFALHCDNGCLVRCIWTACFIS
jgi:hypothetical protein